jgi:hypothetical protein
MYSIKLSTTRYRTDVIIYFSVEDHTAILASVVAERPFCFARVPLAVKVGDDVLQANLLEVVVQRFLKMLKVIDGFSKHHAS